MGFCLALYAFCLPKRFSGSPGVRFGLVAARYPRGTGCGSGGSVVSVGLAWFGNGFLAPQRPALWLLGVMPTMVNRRVPPECFCVPSLAYGC
jgi:hypothetical protein